MLLKEKQLSLKTAHKVSFRAHKPWIKQSRVGGLVYSFGELLWKDRRVPASAPLLEGSLLGRTVVSVAAGGFHCGAVTEQGHVYTWGENTGGQCGLTERGAQLTITGTR